MIEILQKFTEWIDAQRYRQIAITLLSIGLLIFSVQMAVDLLSWTASVRSTRSTVTPDYTPVLLQLPDHTVQGDMCTMPDGSHCFLGGDRAPSYCWGPEPPR